MPTTAENVFRWPDFGVSTGFSAFRDLGILGTFWGIGLGWAGLGWLGWLDLARCRILGSYFRPKTGFSVVVGHGGYAFRRPKTSFPSGLFWIGGFLA